MVGGIQRVHVKASSPCSENSCDDQSIFALFFFFTTNNNPRHAVVSCGWRKGKKTEATTTNPQSAPFFALDLFPSKQKLLSLSVISPFSYFANSFSSALDD